MMEIEDSGKNEKKGLKRSKTVEEIYTKKTQLEHILLRPDTYIGSVERHTQPMWVLDPTTKKIVNRSCSFVPGLYKIFDEILVNAADNKQRDPTMNKIDVIISQEDGFISVSNNGKSIPVVIHKDHKVYIPELVFGHLLTGSNFDDEEEKTTGGRNGYGAKLANIFSTRFLIEVGDTTTSSLYKQEFKKNMTTIQPPKITKYSLAKDYIKVIFYPDFPKFNMNSFDDDILALFYKRVYDIAGTTISKGVKLNVTLNHEKIEGIKKFEDYLQLYEGLEAPVIVEKMNDRWEIGIGPSDGSFQHISFVNSISTNKGGAHINYITEQITSRLVNTLKKKNKDELKPNQIKNHLSIFINCLITNPSFDSQTKENLTTKSSAFGSTCILTEKVFKAVEKSSIIENIHNWAKFKQTNELKKKSGSKRSKLIGITKLDDANHAGTAKSSQCTLILTEGDSAKALAISGLGVVGRDYYGVFPLKGKLLNVREASHAQIMKNEEIQNITKILGLTFGKVYNDTSSLRYGHLMIMTDQDHDGSHIKGLLINFIHYFWPSLLQIPNFLQQFITPIVKCFKGKQQISFYTIPEYHHWKTIHDNGKGWKIKYYKGLGTSTAQEAKEYFSHLNTHEIPFQWDGQANDLIDMAFAKKRVEERKLWLLGKPKDVYIDYFSQAITYDHFINQELILFSYADNERSIAHLMDGLKPSQRKVLYCCFKRNLIHNEIKVAQLAGYVSEHSAYHHGEASLTQTIVGMAQNFVGSNNINLLAPCGQFGTRLMGGKDAASPRYIFTKLEEITRLIFHPDDDDLLDYLEEDGQSIEPAYYMPIIPMALVNGSEGIGTGWSSSIPNYHPLEIIANLRKMIAGEDPSDMVPWFRGFQGKIQGKDGKAVTSFAVTGLIDQLDDQTIQISELPIGKWTTDYKQFLEGVLIGNNAAGDKVGEEGGSSSNSAHFVKDFKENHTDTAVLFTVTCPSEKLQELEGQPEKLIKKFKLDTSISVTNMNLFDVNSQIKKFEGPLQVMKEFFLVRLQYYIKRRQSLCNKLEREWRLLENKMRFVKEIIDGKLIVSNRQKKDLLKELKQRGYEAFLPNQIGPKSGADDLPAEDVQEIEKEEDEVSHLQKGYDYLLNMKIWTLTSEKVKELQHQCSQKLDELEQLKSQTAEDLWLDDLDRLEKAITKLYSDRSAEDEAQRSQSRKAMKSRPPPKSNKRPRASKPKVLKPKPKDDEMIVDTEDDGEDLFDLDDESDESYDEKPKKKQAKIEKSELIKTPVKTENIEKREMKKETNVKKTPASSSKKSTPSSAKKRKVDSEESEDEDYDSELLFDDDDEESDEDSSDDEIYEEVQKKPKSVGNAAKSNDDAKKTGSSARKQKTISLSTSKPLSRQGSDATVTTVASATSLVKSGSTLASPEKKRTVISKPIVIDDDWGADDDQLIIRSPLKTVVNRVETAPRAQLFTESENSSSKKPAENRAMRQQKITNYSQYFTPDDEDKGGKSDDDIFKDSDDDEDTSKKRKKSIPAKAAASEKSAVSTSKKAPSNPRNSTSNNKPKTSTTKPKKKAKADTSSDESSEDIFDDEDDSEFSG